MIRPRHLLKILSEPEVTLRSDQLVSRAQQRGGKQARGVENRACT